MATVLNQKFIFARVEPINVLHHKKPKRIALQEMDFTTMLFFAAENPQAAKKVRYTFSAAGIDLSEIFNEHGFSPVHVAAFKGNTTFLNLWGQTLHSTVDIASKDKGIFPIHLAAQEEQLEAIEVLNSFHCNLDAQTTSGMTAIHVATTNKRYKAIELLSRLGAQIDLATPEEGFTATHLAAMHGDGLALSTLLELGANANAVALENEFTPLDFAACKGHINAMYVLSKFKANPATQDSQGISSLYLAVDNSYVEAVQFLVHIGASIDQKDKLGNTVLHVAANKDSKKMIEILVLLKADVNAQNAQKVTPLHVAACKGNLQSCTALVQHGAKTDIPSSEGDIPLVYAAQNDHVKVVQFLASPDTVNMADQQGLTAVHIAAQNDCDLVLLALRNHKPDLEKQDGHGNTPMHIAAYLGRLKALKTLKNLGANPNSFNRDGTTPLNLAAQKGHKNIVDYLLSLKDIVLIDRNGRNPLHFAIAEKVQDCDLFVALLKAGVDPALKDPTKNISPLEMNYPPLQEALAKIAT